MAAKTRLGFGGFGVRRTGSFASKTADAGIVTDAFLSTQIVSSGLKKPGIPSDTPAWLKTFLEILAGRRGNNIDAPKLQTLTFSASPTKAECEALYTYLNDVRQSVDAILTRLDG